MAGTKYYSSITNQARIKTTTMGNSNIVGVKSAFPNSPIHAGELSYDERLATFQNLVMNGNINEAGSELGLNGPGNGFESFNRDYSQNGAPNIPAIANDIAKLEELNLVSPYFPNLTSPGPGSFDADQAELYAGNIKDRNDIDQWGTGFKGTFNPLKSSTIIGNTKIEKLVNSSGKSFQN